MTRDLCPEARELGEYAAEKLGALPVPAGDSKERACAHFLTNMPFSVQSGMREMGKWNELLGVIGFLQAKGGACDIDRAARTYADAVTPAFELVWGSIGETSEKALLGGSMRVLRQLVLMVDTAKKAELLLEERGLVYDTKRGKVTRKRRGHRGRDVIGEIICSLWERWHGDGSSAAVRKRIYEALEPFFDKSLIAPGRKGPIEIAIGNLQNPGRNY